MGWVISGGDGWGEARVKYLAAGTANAWSSLGVMSPQSSIETLRGQ